MGCTRAIPGASKHRLWLGDLSSAGLQGPSLGHFFPPWMNLYLHRIHRCGILLIFQLFLGPALENSFLLCLYTMVRDEQFFLSFSISPMTNQTSQPPLPRLVAAPQPCGSKTGACSAATTLTVGCSLAQGPWPSLEPESTSWCLHPNWRLQQKALVVCESWSCRLSPS